MPWCFKRKLKIIKPRVRVKIERESCWKRLFLRKWCRIKNLHLRRHKSLLKKTHSVDAVFKNLNLTSQTSLRRNIELIKDEDMGKLKEQYGLNKSKAALLIKMLDDYKKAGIVSIMPNKSKMELAKIDKEKLLKILKEYEDRRFSNKLRYLKKFDFHGMTSEQLKQNYSLYGHKKEKFEKLIDDYRHRKFSYSGLSKKSKLDKELVNKLLAAYAESKEKKRKKGVTFLSLPKVKLMKKSTKVGT